MDPQEHDHLARTVKMAPVLHGTKSVYMVCAVAEHVLCGRRWENC